MSKGLIKTITNSLLKNKAFKEAFKEAVKGAAKEELSEPKIDKKSLQDLVKKKRDIYKTEDSDLPEPAFDMDFDEPYEYGVVNRYNVDDKWDELQEQINKTVPNSEERDKLLRIRNNLERELHKQDPGAGDFYFNNLINKLKTKDEIQQEARSIGDKTNIE